MVQAVENWAEIRGQVEEVTEAGAGVVDVRIRVAGTTPLPGFANLLADAAGRSIRVRFPLEGDAPPLRAGQMVRGVVRRAGPDQYFGRPGSLVVDAQGR